jgi:hypothetical protein
MTQMEVNESGAIQRADGLWVFPRTEFVKERFRYKAGNHIVFGGPSQNGKTSLAFDLLEECATVECPAFVAVSKPRDPVTERRGMELGFRRVSDWPPPGTVREFFREKPRGYLIWPEFGDIDLDVVRSREVTRRLIEDRYAAGVKRKKGILVLDDTYVKSKVLKLDREMTTIHAMAGAMDLGAWTFVQKPTGAGETPLMAYGACEWAFFFSDPDKRSRQRYDEIGGFDPSYVSNKVMTLKKFQCLAIQRTGRSMCIVDKS